MRGRPFPKGHPGGPGRPRRAEREQLSDPELLRLAKETIQDLLQTGSESTRAKLAIHVVEHNEGRAPQRVIQEPVPATVAVAQPVTILDSASLEEASA